MATKVQPRAEVNKVHLRNLDDELYGLLMSGGFLDIERFVDPDYLNEFFFRKKKDADRLVDKLTYDMLDDDAVNMIIAAMLSSQAVKDKLGDYRLKTVPIDEYDLDDKLREKISKCALLVSLTNADALAELIGDVGTTASNVTSILTRLNALERDMNDNFAEDADLKKRVDDIELTIDDVITDHLIEVLNSTSQLTDDICQKLREEINQNLFSQVVLLQEQVDDVQEALELLVGNTGSSLQQTIEKWKEEIVNTVVTELGDHSSELEIAIADMKNEIKGYNTNHEIRFGQDETRITNLENNSDLAWAKGLRKGDEVLKESNLPTSVVYTHNDNYKWLLELREGSTKLKITAVPDELVRQSDILHQWLKALYNGQVQIPAASMNPIGIKDYLNNDEPEAVDDHIFWTFLKGLYRGTSVLPSATIPTDDIVSSYLSDDDDWNWLLGLRNGSKVLNSATLPMEDINDWIADNDDNYKWVVRLRGGEEVLPDYAIPIQPIKDTIADDRYYQWLQQLKEGNTFIPDSSVPYDPVKTIADQRIAADPTVIWAKLLHDGNATLLGSTIPASRIQEVISDYLKVDGLYGWIENIKRGDGSQVIPDKSISYSSVQPHIYAYLNNKDNADRTLMDWLRKINTGDKTAYIPDGSISESSVTQWIQGFLDKDVVYKFANSIRSGTGTVTIPINSISYESVSPKVKSYLDSDEAYQWLLDLIAGKAFIGGSVIPQETINTMISEYLNTILGGITGQNVDYVALTNYINSKVDAKINQANFPYKRIRTYLNSANPTSIDDISVTPSDYIIWQFIRNLYKYRRTDDNSSIYKLSQQQIMDALEEFFRQNTQTDPKSIVYYTDILKKMINESTTFSGSGSGVRPGLDGSISIEDLYQVISSYLWNVDPYHPWLKDVKNGNFKPYSSDQSARPATERLPAESINLENLVKRIVALLDSDSTLNIIPKTLVSGTYSISANAAIRIDFGSRAYARFVRAVVLNADTDIGNVPAVNYSLGGTASGNTTVNIGSQYISSEGSLTVAFPDDRYVIIYNEKDVTVTVKIIYLQQCASI